MPDLQRRQLGRTGVEVTTLGFGAMELRGAPNGPDIDDADAEKLLHAVLDAGINLIDTSIDYGRSEERIGRFLAQRRDEYFLASKCGCVPGAPLGTDHVHTADNIRLGVETSLSRLRTDHLDLVQFHRSLTRAELEAPGVLDTVVALREEGKVRFIGVSGTLPNLDEQIDMGVFDAFQIPYSPLQSEHAGAMSRATAAGAGVIVRGGVARGVPADWDNRSYYMVPQQTLRDRWQGAGLDELLDGASPVEFLLRLTLSNPDLDTTIVGTSNVEHLLANVAAAGKGSLPDAVVEEANRRLAGATGDTAIG